MSALDRLKTNKQGQVLIPNNVTGSEYQEGLNIKQAVTLGAMGLGTFIIVLAFKDTSLATWFGWTVLIIILLIVYQFLIRFLVIDENYLAKQTILLQQAQDKVPADLWDIINIDEDGVIFFQDGRLGLIICAEQATIIGRNENYRTVHYTAISDFYKVLNNNNINWTHINAMVNARTENRLSAINEKLRQTSNSAIREACEKHLAHLRNLEVRTLYEKEYWCLTALSTFGKEKLLSTVQTAAEYLQTAAFNRYTILTKEECYELGCQLLNLNSFDAQSIMVEKAQRMISTPLSVIKQIKFKTDLSEERIATIEKTLAPYKDKTEFVQATDDSFIIFLGNTLSNMIAQKLRFIIKEHRSIEAGYVRSDCFNIKWQDSVDTAIPLAPETDNDTLIDLAASQDVTLFDGEYTGAFTEEDMEQRLDAKAAENNILNMKLFSEIELANKQAQANDRAYKQQQDKEEQQKREEARQAALELEAKKRVTAADFSEDEE